MTNPAMTKEWFSSLLRVCEVPYPDKETEEMVKRCREEGHRWRQEKRYVY